MKTGICGSERVAEVHPYRLITGLEIYTLTWHALNVELHFTVIQLEDDLLVGSSTLI